MAEMWTPLNQETRFVLRRARRGDRDRWSRVLRFLASTRGFDAPAVGGRPAAEKSLRFGDLTGRCSRHSQSCSGQKTCFATTTRACARSGVLAIEKTKPIAGSSHGAKQGCSRTRAACSAGYRTRLSSKRSRRHGTRSPVFFAAPSARSLGIGQAMALGQSEDALPCPPGGRFLDRQRVYGPPP
jgi:hypothetical protein